MKKPEFLKKIAKKAALNALCDKFKEILKFHHELRPAMAEHKRKLVTMTNIMIAFKNQDV